MASEQFRKLEYILVIIMIVLFSTHAVAGNKWMMERMGQNLIKLNHEVVKKIVGTQADGHVSLKARIVQEDGRQLIVIEDLEVATPAPASKPLQTAPAEYETYISYQALDIPGAESLPQKPLGAGTMVLDVRDLEALMDKHPEGRVIKLQQDAINTIDWGKQKKPDHVYLFFW